MATYIANKPCRFGGKAYHIGDKIPGDKIMPRRLGGLLRMGVIVEGAEEVQPKPTPKYKTPKEEVKEQTEK